MEKEADDSSISSGSETLNCGGVFSLSVSSLLNDDVFLLIPTKSPAGLMQTDSEGRNDNREYSTCSDSLNTQHRSYYRL